MRESRPADTPTAARLKLLRQRLFDENGRAFAARLGMPYETYMSFESRRPLTRDAAIQIVRRVPGVTLDWLFLGERRGLSYDLAEKLGEITRPDSSRLGT